MRSIATVLGMCVGLLIQGCNPVPPTDISQVKIGNTCFQVQTALGNPVEVREGGVRGSDEFEPYELEDW